MNDASTPLPADRIRALGRGATLPQTQAVYAGASVDATDDGIRATRDLAYGPHPRHRVDLYRPAVAARTGGAPILVFLHGGGFVRGDKSMRENVGAWGARQGFVVAVPNYRLAPESRWPAGPEDVSRLHDWLARGAGSFGGDGERIVLAGESAGAAHVAAAALIRGFRPTGRVTRGLAVLSGPYDALLEGRARHTLGIPTPDPRNDAYFGPSEADWYAGSIIDRIDVDPFPVWIAFAEMDLLQMQVQAGQLFATLVRRHGFAPRIDRLDGHNHFSPGCSIGTSDTSVSTLLAAFVRACTEPDALSPAIP